MGLSDMTVSPLSAEQVTAIKKYEQEFKTKYGRDVILIAFND